MTSQTTAYSVSIIIPVLNEADSIVDTLQQLKEKLRDYTAEIILVDGGSADNTVELATPYVDRVVVSEQGRAVQMNAGAEVASGDYLVFLHCDTSLPESPFPFLREYPVWGFYRVRLSGDAWPFRMIERMMTIRSSLTRVATGDQCIFVSRPVFVDIGGFTNIPLMEDVEISKRLRRLAPPWVVKKPVVTSSRRWEHHGVLKTILLMWYLRALYFCGVKPSVLVKKYYGS